MKLKALFIAAFAVSLAGAAFSQNPIAVRPHRHVRAQVNTAGLTVVQSDLMGAISSMKSALPIYDGHRVHSIGLAHRALLIVDRALNGPSASVRVRPHVVDNVRSRAARRRYSADQIAASQQAMATGLNDLNQAERDLISATNGQPGQRGAKVSALLQQSIAQATTAIGLHQRS